MVGPALLGLAVVMAYYDVARRTVRLRGGVRFPASVGPALEALSAHHDLVLVDLPRGAELPSGCLCLLVTGLDLRSAVATEALVARARSTRAENVSVALAVRPVGEDVSPDDLEAMVEMAGEESGEDAWQLTGR